MSENRLPQDEPTDIPDENTIEYITKRAAKRAAEIYKARIEHNREMSALPKEDQEKLRDLAAEAARRERDPEAIEASRQLLNQSQLNLGHEPHHYNRKGELIGLGDWAVLMEDPTYIQILDDYIEGTRVSTVWMGIDLSFNRSRPPLIFETMIFSDVPELDGLQWRFATEEGARAGHVIITAAVRETLEHKTPFSDPLRDDEIE